MDAGQRARPARGADEVSQSQIDAAKTIVTGSLAFLTFLAETGRWTGTREDLAHCRNDLLVYLDDDGMGPPTLDDVESRAVPPESELAALAALPVVEKIHGLLSWVGNGRPITGTQVPKPAHIADIAESTGTALTPLERNARTILDVQSLMTLWDTALHAGLIATSSTKVTLAPAAVTFGESLPVVRAVVSHHIRLSFGSDRYRTTELLETVKMVAAQMVVAGMTDSPMAPPEPPTRDELLSGNGIAMHYLGDALVSFEHAGWLIIDEVVTVPAALRPAVYDALQTMPYTGTRAAAAPEGSRLTILVQLLGTEPMVWRRVVVDCTLALDALHLVMQSSFGWQNSHLHEFTVGQQLSGVRSFQPAEWLDRSTDAEPEGLHTVGSLLTAVGDTITYVYDFGDFWEHLLTLEAVDYPDSSVPVAQCTAGANRAPYDDAGGPPGWSHHVAAANDPTHESHEESRDWLGLRPGQTIDPTQFDLDAADAAVSSLFSLDRPWSD